MAYFERGPGTSYGGGHPKDYQPYDSRGDDYRHGPGGGGGGAHHAGYARPAGWRSDDRAYERHHAAPYPAKAPASYGYGGRQDYYEGGGGGVGGGSSSRDYGGPPHRAAASGHGRDYGGGGSYGGGYGGGSGFRRSGYGEREHHYHHLDHDRGGREGGSYQRRDRSWSGGSQPKRPRRDDSREHERYDKEERHSRSDRDTDGRSFDRDDKHGRQRSEKLDYDDSGRRMKNRRESFK